MHPLPKQFTPVTLPACNGQNSLWDLIKSNSDLSFMALLADVGNTNITTVLNSTAANYTVFASTNDAVSDYMSAIYGVSSMSGSGVAMWGLYVQLHMHTCNCIVKTPVLYTHQTPTRAPPTPPPHTHTQTPPCSNWRCSSFCKTQPTHSWCPT